MIKRYMHSVGTRVLPPALLIVMGLLLPRLAEAGTRVELRRGIRTTYITDTVTWKGQIKLNGPVQVESGATLQIEPGTVITALAMPDKRVRLLIIGRLLAEGTAEEPIIFKSNVGNKDSWSGIIIEHQGVSRSRLRYCRIENAVAGLSIVNTNMQLQNLSFKNCTDALRISQKSFPVVINCRFEENDRGIVVGGGASPLISESVFSKNSQCAILHESGAQPFVVDNSFTHNNIGILAQNSQNNAFYYGNTFKSNKSAIRLTHSSTADIVGNEFSKNITAIDAVWRSIPYIDGNVFNDNITAISGAAFCLGDITHNLFEKNSTALNLWCGTSGRVNYNDFKDNFVAIKLGITYTRATGNNFVDNTYALKLDVGSPDAEVAREGARARVQTLDFTRNYWGPETTAEMEQLGPGRNVTAIWDGYDFPLIMDRGFFFRKERFVYRSWLTAPVENAARKTVISDQEIVSRHRRIMMRKRGMQKQQYKRQK